MSSIWDLANPQLRDLAVYEPGKPIEETAREIGADAATIIKLASNENPLGPSPAAVAAMQEALASSHLYPDGGGYYVRNALAAQLGVASDQIILGNGSNEIIEFVGHAFLNPQVEVVTPEHAFVAYKITAKIFGAPIREVAARTSFDGDLEALADAIKPETRVVFIANPNNPTGTLIAQDAVDRFMARVPEHVLVVFDEAYFEYVPQPPNTLKFISEGRNVLVLRTFSKIHGLASLRLGYGIARPELITVLQKSREPFNVNGLAQAAAVASLADAEHQRRTRALTDEGRNFFEVNFAQMGLRFLPSAGNFLLVHVGDGLAMFRELLQRRIIVRALKGYDLAAWVRVSIGTMEQNRACIDAMKQILAGRATA